MNDTTLLIRLDDPRYPEILRNVIGAPNPLYVRGNIPNPGTPSIAIVGTRRATPEGVRIAKTIAHDLSRVGTSIISGLALGIDAAAHAGALEGGTPTYAVLGNGIDSIYPAAHEDLAHKIITHGGGIISEYAPGTPSYPNQFLERNRIISGLARAVIVIEAPARSGSLSTARHAAEQGRDVFVVPGAPSNSNYTGSHFLIREGARLIESAQDVLDDLGIETTPPLDGEGDPGVVALLTLIQQYPHGVDVDKLIEITHFEAPSIMESLTLLACEGTIHERNGLFYPGSSSLK